MAPAKESSTESAGPAKLPPELADIRAALRVRTAKACEAVGTPTGANRNGVDGLSAPGSGQTSYAATPERISEQISNVVKGSSYQYISNPATSTFSSDTPPPDIAMTVVHHKDPQHRAFFLPPSNIQSLNYEDVKHYLELALQHITYQSDKIDTLETQLLWTSQYMEAAHKKLYEKGKKKKPNATELLAAQGKSTNF